MSGFKLAPATPLNVFSWTSRQPQVPCLSPNSQKRLVYVARKAPRRIRKPRNPRSGPSGLSRPGVLGLQAASPVSPGKSRCDWRHVHGPFSALSRSWELKFKPVSDPILYFCFLPFARPHYPRKVPGKFPRCGKILVIFYDFHKIRRFPKIAICNLGFRPERV